MSGDAVCLEAASGYFVPLLLLLVCMHADANVLPLRDRSEAVLCSLGPGLYEILPLELLSMPLIPPCPALHSYCTSLPAHNRVVAMQGFLTVAFLVETLLMGMHSKPNPLDNLVHMLLTGVMVACVVVCAAEIAAPNSLLLALLRPMVVFFQGTWFWHVGAIMFWGECGMSWGRLAELLGAFRVAELQVALAWFRIR